LAWILTRVFGFEATIAAGVILVGPARAVSPRT